MAHPARLFDLSDPQYDLPLPAWSRRRRHPEIPMIRSCTLALLLGGALMAPASTGSAQSREDAVVQVVRDLFDAMRAGDGQRMRTLFHEGARLSGPSTNPDGSFNLRNTPVESFIDGIVTASATRLLDERIYDPEVRISKNLATVWVAYDFYLDQELSHCGFDAFQLAYDGTTWKIFQIADTRLRDECPER